MSQKMTELLTLSSVGAPTSSTSGAPDTVVYHAVIDPTFTVGPKVHGGSVQSLIAHAAGEAFRVLVADADPTVTPVAIASDYLGAPDPAEIELVVRLRKTGRTVSVASVDAIQGGRVMIASSVTLARLDTDAARHSGATLLDGTGIEPPADGIAIDDSPIAAVLHWGPALDLVLEPTTPLVRGETGDPVVRGWTRPKGSDPTVEFAVLVCDISPPVVMNLGYFGWAPTVQLTTYIRRQPAPGWLRFAASSVEVGQGLFEEDHLVVDSTGAVVAQSRQLALIPQAR
ncbi:thioesterase family protein [Gordonia soli]|uniref:DAGKc domain-containing protein n=1 Tax=Gordonia soli NBRC 108243 TaxID=1223545 RepID=M0QKR3_9ACTN|nr:thioesterase family protein [Gordonia soli]GAC68017.1 hypothetical protein GS4_11_02890 [Gordonia soli NBRC 108243]